MKFIAHRGLVNNTKDNSYESIINGINSDKYIGIETDIRETKDHIFILYHDPLFKNKLIKNMNYKELNSNGIVKLESILKINTKKIMLLEIKDYNIDIKRFYKLIKKYNRNIYIMSFYNKVLENLYQLDKSLVLGSLNYVLNDINHYHYQFICILNIILNKKIISNYQNKNIFVIGYGVKKKEYLKYDITYIVDDDIF